MKVFWLIYSRCFYRTNITLQRCWTMTLNQILKMCRVWRRAMHWIYEECKTLKATKSLFLKRLRTALADCSTSPMMKLEQNPCLKADMTESHKKTRSKTFASFWTQTLSDSEDLNLRCVFFLCTSYTCLHVVCSLFCLKTIPPTSSCLKTTRSTSMKSAKPSLQIEMTMTKT